MMNEFNTRRYPCRNPGCTASSAYYAKGNDAEYGHLCVDHYRSLSLDKKDDYMHEIKDGRYVYIC